MDTLTFEMIQGLRGLATLLENHLELPVHSSVSVLGRAADKEHLAACARAMGSVDKIMDNNYFNIRKSFGPITYEVYAPREEVCERVVVGTKHIPASFVPEQYSEAHEEEIIEWHCPEALLMEGDKK